MTLSEKRYYQMSLLWPILVSLPCFIWLYFVPFLPEADENYALHGLAAVFSLGAAVAGPPYLVMVFIIIKRSMDNEDVLKKDLILSPFYLIVLSFPYNFIMTNIVERNSVYIWILSIPFTLIIGYMFVVIVFTAGKFINK